MASEPRNKNIELGEAAVVREDYAEAFAFFEAAAEEGCAQALTFLSSMYEDGLGVEHDSEKVLSLLYQAASVGDAEACGRLGYLHAVGKFVEQNLGAAVEYHKIAAKQGLANSQCDLGHHYARGIGVEQDFSKAEQWYTLAAEAFRDLARQREEDAELFGPSWLQPDGGGQAAEAGRVYLYHRPVADRRSGAEPQAAAHGQAGL